VKTMGNKAMILAAGLGTRLRPWTDRKPKALLEYRGTTLLEYVIGRLREEGFDEIIINIHHFARSVIDFVESKKRFGIRIEFSDEREELLDTGGAIKKASWFFGNEPFPVYNVDIRSDIDLRKMVRSHLEHKALVTLAVRDRVTSRSLLMDAAGTLRGWRDNRTGHTVMIRNRTEPLKPIAFSGVQVIDPALFAYFPPENRFSIIPFYLELAEKQPVHLYRHDRDEWIDMGRKESYT
jgi:MurNAc alpha-1-phosphate uridylyltransferase